jgi:hypothetical protein
LSLHHGLVLGWWGGRVELGDAKRPEDGRRALSAFGDGALSGAVAEFDVDDTHGLERGEGFGGGKIETSGFVEVAI